MEVNLFIDKLESNKRYLFDVMFNKTAQTIQKYIQNQANIRIDAVVLVLFVFLYCLCGTVILHGICVDTFDVRAH